MNFSTNTRSSPKLDFASDFARAKPFRDLLARMGDAHALAAAAGRRLDHHGIADLVGDLGRVLGALDHAEEAGHGRDFRRVGEFLGFDLVAHRLDGARIGADEDDAGLGQRLGESGALGEEAIAGMHGLGAGLPAGLDDLVDHQVGFRRGGGPMRDRLVGHLDMQRVGVGVGIDGDGPDPQPLGGLHHAAGDLAAIGDEDFREHARPPPACSGLAGVHKRRGAAGKCGEGEAGVALRPRRRPWRRKSKVSF